MLKDIYNYLPISETLATSGQPTAAQLVEIRQAGFERVINLALPTSDNALPDERSQVEAQGMTYIAIPVLWEHPTVEDFEQFQTVMAENSDRKIWVHCAANMRVSAFVYLHQCLRGVSPEVAIASLHAIWTPNQTWQQFIHQVLSKLSTSKIFEG